MENEVLYIPGEKSQAVHDTHNLFSARKTFDHFVRIKSPVGEIIDPETLSFKWKSRFTLLTINQHRVG